MNNNTSWVNSSVFYHIYPLGFCGADRIHTDNTVNHSILKIIDWIKHFKKLNINALYLGPVFESSSHGYDTRDYEKIDSRLGDEEDLKKVSEKLHDSGIRLVLDGVFNHVGREFFAFSDVIKNKQNSPYCDWFVNLSFNGQSPFGDPFWYEGWEGHYELVKLNLKNSAVSDYLINAVLGWIVKFDIDGLRLDVAYMLDQDFIRKLSQAVKNVKPDFWLMGEVIHGNYAMYVGDGLLDSVTNYECYKGLYSSHNDKNYFEIAHSIIRQFGDGGNGGIYNGMTTYNFVDNHDVTRLASILKNKTDINNVYTLLFTMPGVPSVYYGSEFAIEGVKEKNGSDDVLRPELKLSDFDDNTELCRHIAALSKMKKTLSALSDGYFKQILLQNRVFAFMRKNSTNEVFVALNIDKTEASVTLPCSYDLIDAETKEIFKSVDSKVVVNIPVSSGRVLYELALAEGIK